MAFVNLYALLGVEPTATETEIVKAMRQMAQHQLISLDDLKLCKNTLLDPEARKKYNAQLFAECPEVLEKLAKPKEPESKPALEKKSIKIQGKQKNNRKLWVYSAIFILIGLAAVSGIAYIYYKPIFEVKNAVKDLLKDPESARFYDIKKVVNGKTISYCGEVNARAMLGGYGGKQRFIYEEEDKKATLVPSSKPFEESVEVYISALWKIRCEKLDYDKVMDEVKQWEKLESLRKDAKESLDSLIEYKYSGSSSYTEVENMYQEIVDKTENAKKRVSIYN